MDAPREIAVADFHFGITIWVAARPHIGRLEAPVRQFGAALQEALEMPGKTSG